MNYEEELKSIVNNDSYDPPLEVVWAVVGWLIAGDEYETEGEFHLDRNQKGYSCRLISRKPGVAFRHFQEEYTSNRWEEEFSTLENEYDIIRTTTMVDRQGKQIIYKYGLVTPVECEGYKTEANTKGNKGGIKKTLLNTIREAHKYNPFFSSTLELYGMEATGKALYE